MTVASLSISFFFCPFYSIRMYWSFPHLEKTTHSILAYVFTGIVAFHYCMLNLPRTALLKKTDCPPLSAASQQLPVDFQWQASASCLHTGVCSGLNVHRAVHAAHPLCIPMCGCHVLEDSVSLYPPTLSGYSSLVSSSTQTPEPREGEI